MSWIERLCDTYDHNRDAIGTGAYPLLPLYHTVQNAQITVVLDHDGNFRRARVVPRDDAPTIIPATQDSAGRAGSTMAPHPLCDTLQYVASDYLDWGGNPNKKKNETGFTGYVALLQKWADWSQDPKLLAVLKYVRKGCLIADLVADGVLIASPNKTLMLDWVGASDAPPIFRIIKQSNKRGQYEGFVRFSVEVPGEIAELWKDAGIWDSWAHFYPTMLDVEAVCLVSGDRTKITSNHPKFIRYPGDGAKLISSNDTNGFTFLGRFAEAGEACNVGIQASQKAHSALRWLIGRQGHKYDDQVVVTWAPACIEVPDPLKDSLDLLVGATEPLRRLYTAQEVAQALSKLASGYAAKLPHTNSVVVLVLDSASPGRMAVRYYRELTGSEYLQRIMNWHTGCRWHQCIRKKNDFIEFVGAPAPRSIAEAAYGRSVEGKAGAKLLRATVERILPCIVDGVPLPADVVRACVQRASQRNSFEKKKDRGSPEWEMALGIACALFSYHKRGEFQMALDRERKTRDYLYGRLLAVAEHIESAALYLAGENRDTSVAKLMQRFSDRPRSTWVTIEKSLVPYQTRLRAQRPALSSRLNRELDEIMWLFASDAGAFEADQQLSGEYLLAYHCERKWVWDNLRRSGNNNHQENANEQEGREQ